jgi:hypothetical protein
MHISENGGKINENKERREGKKEEKLFYLSYNK